MPMGRGRPSICPKCGSTRSQSKGFYLRAYGRAKDRKCNDCGRRYTVKMQNRLATSEERVADVDIPGVQGIADVPEDEVR